MTKHNKKHYQTKEKPKANIIITGVVFLQHIDDEEASMASKGDLLVYPQNEALQTNRLGEYEQTGFTGYFKVDISDGKNWQPLLIGDIFTENENHFSRKERPIDTYNICLEILKNLQGKNVFRTYREHYQLQIDI